MKLKKINYKKIGIMVAILVGVVFSTAVFAEPDLEANTTIVDSLVKMLGSIFQKISVVIFFFGFIQLGFAIKSDNPDLKSQALKTIVAAVVVFTVSTSVDIFLKMVATT